MTSHGSQSDSNLEENSPRLASTDFDSFEDAQRPDLTSSVLFHGVAYLGSMNIESPRSEEEIQKTMSILNDQIDSAIEVTLCVPDNSDGSVRLVDPLNEFEIVSYPINQILFCTRSPLNTSFSCCWAFTTTYSSSISSNGKSSTENFYQSHVFRCNNEDAIYRIIVSFANAFRRVNPNKSNSRQLHSGQILSNNVSSTFDGSIKFRAFFDIKEETIDNKGNSTFNSVPRPEKNVFRLRKDVKKLVIVTLQQIRGFPLTIERCFGLLLAQGRNVPASDMQLLDLEAMAKSDDNRYTIRANWNPLARTFKHLTHLNEETSKGARIFFTVALDVVISGIYEPVRFLIEGKARVCQWNKSNESSSQDLTDTIWSSFKKIPPFIEEFDLILKQGSSNTKHQNEIYEVISLESKSQSERQNKSCRLSSSGIDDENDDVVISGSGEVSKECDEEVLTNWNEILIKWKKNYSERPRGLQNLVQQGIPQALRCEVWQLLTESIEKENEMIETYRSLLTKNSSCERVILNDLDRTFPNHEYFKSGAIGQESLYKLSRAYSVRDEEVGYCQGLSFVIATILIQVPEEQAFALLCKLMENKRYELRELYKANFENLQLKLYQLQCLMEEILPDLASHFYDLKIECHMFASQWFLTLFTAKFPLYLVFRIIDLFLFDGFKAIFSVALALLKCNQKDLLSLDFEGVMRYFRVNLPKKYLCESDTDELIQNACLIKINVKKLKRFEKDYFFARIEEEEKETPIQRLETENKRLTESCLRAELENEVLALELVNDRVPLTRSLHQAEEKIENLKDELEKTKSIVRQSEELTIRLNEELKYIRQAFQDTCNELQRTQKSLENSKQVCAQLSDQFIKQKEKYFDKIEYFQKNCCESCQDLFNPSSPSPISTPDEEIFTNVDQFSSLLAARLRQVEIELAEKKLALTEALCQNQELNRQLRQSTSIANSINDSDCSSIDQSPTTMTSLTSSWLRKTVQTIKANKN